MSEPFDDRRPTSTRLPEAPPRRSCRDTARTGTLAQSLFWDGTDSLHPRNREMNRDPILFRVDATPEKGYERLARCQILAMALQRRRRPTYFVSQLEPRALALNIKRAGNDW